MKIKLKDIHRHYGLVLVTKAKRSLKNSYIGNSLVVQWLRLHDHNAGGPGSIPSWGTRSHMPQQRSKILHATTKTQ